MAETEKSEITERPGVRLVDLAREYLNFMQIEKGCSANTIEAYRRDIAKYVEYLVEEVRVSDPEDISENDVSGFIYFLKQRCGDEYAINTIGQHVTAVHNFHRFLVAEGYASDDRSVALLYPKRSKRLPRALGRGEVERLLESPQGGDPLAIRDRMILEVLYATGLRISELAELKMKDVSMNERLITCHGKGDKWRIVPFGKGAAESIDDYLNYSREEILKDPNERSFVLNARGRGLTRQGLWLIVKEHAKNVGLGDKVSPHVLRHTFATHLLEGGAGILVVAEILGHSDVSTTEIYTEVTRVHLEKVYSRCHPRA